MLFEVEKQAMERRAVKVHRVCEGDCPGRVSVVPPCRIMRRNPPGFTIAGPAGKFELPYPESR